MGVAGTARRGCQLHPSLSGWAVKFRCRYLDLAPVAERFPAPTTDGPASRPAVSKRR